MCSASQTDAGAPRRVAFSLGSNCGDRLKILEQACDSLCALFGDLRLSQVYETEPVDCPPGSPPFLNACVEVFTAMPPEEIMAHCLHIESELGRKRGKVRGEARTCDIDFLYYGEMRINSPALILPHPRAHLRRFVLQPLCDIDPSLVLPGQTETVAQLLDRLPDEPQVRPFNI